MAEQLRFSGPLHQRLAGMLSDESLNVTVLNAVQERAPDEHQALAYLLQLGEISPLLLNEALRDSARTEDLLFCLGGSEVIASGLRTAGSSWVEVFDSARHESERSIEAPPFASAHALGEFKRFNLLRIAIRDLLQRATVLETIRAMSQLAEGCIRGVVELAAREFAREHLLSDFIVLAMGIAWSPGL